MHSRSQIGELNHDVPVFFLDAHFTRDNDVEKTFFETQATRLYKVIRIGLENFLLDNHIS